VAPHTLTARHTVRQRQGERHRIGEEIWRKSRLLSVMLSVMCDTTLLLRACTWRAAHDDDASVLVELLGMHSYMSTTATRPSHPERHIVVIVCCSSPYPVPGAAAAAAARCTCGHRCSTRTGARLHQTSRCAAGDGVDVEAGRQLSHFNCVCISRAYIASRLLSSRSSNKESRLQIKVSYRLPFVAMASGSDRRLEPACLCLLAGAG
jgi:hypothetical protein